MLQSRSGFQSERMITGEEISELAEAALARVDDIDLFARIDPDQKRRIIAALRHHNHVVGFMGDGVNDAPAIHAAHVAYRSRRDRSRASRRRHDPAGS